LRRILVASIGGLRAADDVAKPLEFDHLRVGFSTRAGVEPTLVSGADGVGASNRDRTGDLQGHNLAL
jgi:hypothetical protein